MGSRVSSVNPVGNPSGRDPVNQAARDDECMPAGPDLPKVARRLRRLIDHLKLTDAEFAELTKIKPSYLSRLVSGERGSSGDVPKLVLHTRDHLHLSGHYWSAKDDVDPAECIRSPPEEDGKAMQKRDMGTDMQAGLARLAAERDDPPEVVKALMLTAAPAGADPLWWVRRYLDLLDAHR